MENENSIQEMPAEKVSQTLLEQNKNINQTLLEENKKMLAFLKWIADQKFNLWSNKQQELYLLIADNEILEAKLF